MTDFSEPELVLPALVLLEQSAAGLTTTDLIRELRLVLKPSGNDLRILAGRRDDHFSQKVRNLVSHRTLEGEGLAHYNGSRGHHSITAAGRRFVESARGRGEIAYQVTPTPRVAAPAVFPPYRRADEAPATRRRDPFSVDPNLVDRGLAAHASIQNVLASWVSAHGWSPLSPGASAADFDLCWDDGSFLNVAEVKSLTAANEVGQLRLGLGQVLHYSMLLEGGRPVRSILAVEHQPRDARWVGLCATHAVILVWPSRFDALVAEGAD